MKVLIVNTHDTRGGAARAAYRLHQSLQSIGVQSAMLVQRKYGDDRTVLAPVSKIKGIWAALRPEIDLLPANRYKHRKQVLFSPAWCPFTDALQRINESDADVVHLHWVNGGFLRPEDIARINKPIIWSLHDMWAFTGGCHYDQDGGCYLSGCGKCPMLGSHESEDMSRRVYIRKQKAFSRVANMTVVGLSRWLANSAANSPLLGRFPVVNLPNPIDTDVYAPVDRDVARRLLNLPVDRKLVAFGAMNATGDPRKGYAQLVEALGIIKDRDISLLVFGASPPPNPPDFGFPAHYLGGFNDDLSLRILYSAADVMVVSSLQENLSNVIMESLSCGTPVVAFDIGGNGDLIDHKQSGYLAQPLSADDLAKGIEWVLHCDTPSSLRVSARAKVEACFEMKRVAEQYRQLYLSVQKQHGEA